MIQVSIQIPQRIIDQFCKRHHIAKMALFGSVLRDDFTSDSDVDVLVEFKEGHVPGLAFFTIQAELSEILGRKVDLNTAEWISQYFRSQVLREAALIYEQT
jgi:predicted nucleotidyltransferase